MGEDKALLPFGSFDTLIQFQLDKLSKLFETLFISCKDKTKFNFDANFIEDQNKQIYAPTAGFVSVFETLHATKFFAMSVDTPFVSKEIIASLIKNDSEIYDATVAMYEQKPQPLCGIYHRSILERFLQMEKKNVHKLGQLLHESATNFIPYNDTKAFFNLNDKEQYQQALQIL